jgi:hypothetical protein
MQGLWSSSKGNLKGEGANEMSNIQHYKNFRIWAAVGTAIIYVFLAATGNA